MERQTDSARGTGWDWAAENQLWNWVNGDGEREVSERVDFVYWSAWPGAEVEDLPVGATVEKFCVIR